MISNVDKNNKFSFEPITADDISQKTKHVDINKATQEDYIPTKLDINKATQENYRPTKLVKRFDNLIVDYLEQNFNNCLIKGTFPKDFKKAVVHPTHRKDCKRKIKL